MFVSETPRKLRTRVTKKPETTRMIEEEPHKEKKKGVPEIAETWVSPPPEEKGEPGRDAEWSPRKKGLPNPEPLPGTTQGKLTAKARWSNEI